MEHHKWMHGVLLDLLVDATHGAGAGRASHYAHVLLAGLDVDPIDEMLSNGLSIDAIRRGRRR